MPYSDTSKQMSNSDQKKKKDDIKSFSKKAMGIFSDISRGGVNSELRKMQDTLQEMEDLVKGLEPEGSLTKRTPLHQPSNPQDPEQTASTQGPVNQTFTETQIEPTRKLFSGVNNLETSVSKPFLNRHEPQSLLALNTGEHTTVNLRPTQNLSEEAALNIKQPRLSVSPPDQQVLPTTLTSAADNRLDQRTDGRPQYADTVLSARPHPSEHAAPETVHQTTPARAPANPHVSEVDVASLSAYAQQNPDQIQLWTQIFQSMVDLQSASDIRANRDSSPTSGPSLMDDRSQDTLEMLQITKENSHNLVDQDDAYPEDEKQPSYSRLFSDRETQASNLTGPRQFRTSKPGIYMGPVAIFRNPSILPFSRPSQQFVPPVPKSVISRSNRPPSSIPWPHPLEDRPQITHATQRHPHNNPRASAGVRCVLKHGGAPAARVTTTTGRRHTTGSLVRELIDLGLYAPTQHLAVVFCVGSGGTGPSLPSNACLVSERDYYKININSNLYLMLLESFICSEPSEALLGRPNLYCRFVRDTPC